MIIRYARIAALAASAAILAACGGGSGGGTGPGPLGDVCDPGTQVQIASPRPNSTGVSTTIGSIEIVANGNNSTLEQSFANWDVILTSPGGNITGGTFARSSDPGGYQPFTSDYYYRASIPQLPPYQTFNVYINYTGSNCGPVAVGQFST